MVCSGKDECKKITYTYDWTDPFESQKNFLGFGGTGDKTACEKDPPSDEQIKDACKERANKLWDRVEEPECPENCVCDLDPEDVKTRTLEKKWVEGYVVKKSQNTTCMWKVLARVVPTKKTENGTCEYGDDQLAMIEGFEDFFASLEFGSSILEQSKSQLH